MAIISDLVYEDIKYGRHSLKGELLQIMNRGMRLDFFYIQLIGGSIKENMP